MQLLTQSTLSPDEEAQVKEIIHRIEANLWYNLRRKEYYEAHRSVQNLDISVPDSFRNLSVAVGWPGLVVDALDERLNIRSAVVPGHQTSEFGLDSIIAENELEQTWHDSHIDAMVQGVAFETVTLGDRENGEPEVLVTIEAPTTMSGIFNPRRRSLDAAGSIVKGKNGKVIAFTLFTRKSILKLAMTKDGTWTVEERQEHKLGRPPVRMLVNRARASRQWGRSEITRPIIAATDSAMRTLLTAELSRELYGAPTRVILDASEKYFTDSLGNASNAWRAYLGRFLALPRDESAGKEGTQPRIEQLSSSSPAPYTDLIKMYSEMVAGEAALPPTYLGFVTENPASADQIRAVEARHVKRAERRQKAFGAAHRGALLDAVALRDDLAPADLPRELTQMKISWFDAATPTKAAAADAISKQVAAGVLPPRSRVVLEGLGYDELQIQQIEDDWRREDARKLTQSIFNRGQQEQTEPVENGGGNDGNAR